MTPLGHSTRDRLEVGRRADRIVRTRNRQDRCGDPAQLASQIGSGQRRTATGMPSAAVAAKPSRMRFTTSGRAARKSGVNQRSAVAGTRLCRSLALIWAIRASSRRASPAARPWRRAQGGQAARRHEPPAIARLDCRNACAGSSEPPEWQSHRRPDRPDHRAAGAPRIGHGRDGRSAGCENPLQALRSARPSCADRFTEKCSGSAMAPGFRRSGRVGDGSAGPDRAWRSVLEKQRATRGRALLSWRDQAVASRAGSPGRVLARAKTSIAMVDTTAGIAKIRKF